MKLTQTGSVFIYDDDEGVNWKVAFQGKRKEMIATVYKNNSFYAEVSSLKGNASKTQAVLIIKSATDNYTPREESKNPFRQTSIFDFLPTELVNKFVIKKADDNGEKKEDDFFLDLTDDYVWIIKSKSGQVYKGIKNDGFNSKKVMLALIDKLNKAHRPNIEQREDGLYVCWSEHEKHEGCDYSPEISYND